MSAEKPEELRKGSFLGSPEIEEQILSQSLSNENISAVPSKTTPDLSDKTNTIVISRNKSRNSRS